MHIIKLKTHSKRYPCIGRVKAGVVERRGGDLYQRTSCIGDGGGGEGGRGGSGGGKAHLQH